MLPPLTDAVTWTDAEVRSGLAQAMPEAWSFQLDEAFRGEEGAWAWSFEEGPRVIVRQHALDEGLALRTAYAWLRLYLARQDLSRDPRWVRPASSLVPLSVGREGAHVGPEGHPEADDASDLDPGLLETMYEAHKHSQGQG